MTAPRLIEDADIEFQVQAAQDLVISLLRQANRGVPEQAALVHDLQRTQGYLSLVLKMFRERRG